MSSGYGCPVGMDAPWVWMSGGYGCLVGMDVDEGADVMKSLRALRNYFKYFNK